MIGLSALFYTMMHNTHFWLAETWFGRNIIDFSDHNARVFSHRWLGVSMCIITILHVWTIVFPAIFSGYNIEVRAGSFVWPLSEQKPMGFQHANTTTEVMMMQVDDVYRLIMISLLLGPIVFVSVKWMSSNYRVGIRIHQFIMLMYFVDICRRHTHPHCWVFNIPFFLVWALDTFVGHWWRRQQTPVERIMISPNYMLIYWKSTFPYGLDFDSIANVFYIRTMCHCCRFERSHPFTTWTRRNVVLSDLRKYIPFASQQVESQKYFQSLYSDYDEGGNDWNRAILLRTYTEKCAMTREMREVPELNMSFWGSFRFGKIARCVSDFDTDVILVGGGSAATFLVDALSYLSTFCRHFEQKGQEDVVMVDNKVWNSSPSGSDYYPTSSARYNLMLFKASPWTGSFIQEKPSGPDYVTRVAVNTQGPSYVMQKATKTKKNLGIIYTSNDPYLIQFFINLVDDLLLKNRMPSTVRLHITVALTGKAHPVTVDTSHVSWGKFVRGRANIAKEVAAIAEDRKCNLFCQGGVSLQGAVRDAASQTHKTYHEAHSFDSGPSNYKLSCTCSLMGGL